MATINIQFNNPLNVSVQASPAGKGGDILYGTMAVRQSGINNPFDSHAPVMIGEIVGVDHDNMRIVVETTFSINDVNKLGYLFFNKNKAVSVSGILGYYALTEYRNYSKNKAEIFATGTEYAPSSK